MVLRGSVHTDGFVIDYAAFGAGERAFVMLPGISLTSVVDAAEAVADAYRSIAAQYRVVLFERKRDIADGYFVDDMARDTAAAMGMLGIRNAVIFGVSQGAMIAQRLAEFYPDLVHRLILASPAARPNAAIEEIMTRWRDWCRAGMVHEVCADFCALLYSGETQGLLQDAFASVEKSVTRADCDRFAILTEGVRIFDGYGDLSRITCPTLVLAGKEDRVFGTEPPREIAEKLNCDFYFYENYGHAVYDEAPDFKERMLEFLNKEKRA